MNDTIDIVDRLRIAWTSCSQKINDERNAAADEIKRLRAERDEARRIACENEAAFNRMVYNNSECSDPIEVMRERGWDCFKEEG